MESSQAELKKVLGSVVWPVLFVMLLWIIKGFELLLDESLYHYGIYPLDIKGLRGVLFSPLLHGDAQHLFSNSIPLVVLGFGLFYFYGRLGWTVFIFSWVLSGIWLWVFARESYHIGASTIVYALAAFHVLSGLLRREKHLLAFTLLVFFLYGGMIWGIFPDFFPHRNISWEGHLTGSMAGIILAIYYRRQGPQREKPQWEDDEDDDDDDDDDQFPYWKTGMDQDPRKIKRRVRYYYRPRRGSR